jgi:hypothetical protein
VACLYALVSPGGSPGVTTAALALAFGWPGPVIVAECDPSGGSILAGTMAGHLPGGPGLVEHAIEAGRNPIAAASGLASQLIPLDGKRTRMLLPGLTDPRQAAGLSAAWPAVAGSLTAQPCDVIADCGRLDGGAGTPLAVMSAASTVVLVLRPTLRQAWAARPRVEMLAALLGGTSRIVLLLTGTGTYPAREIAGALDLEVAASLPDDPRSAAVLSEGERRRGRGGTGKLVSAAAAAGQALRKKAAALTGDQTMTPASVFAETGPNEPGLAENGRGRPDWGAGR